MIKWEQLANEDVRPIHYLAVRASQLAARGAVFYPVLDASMDITACHLHTPLDLPALSAANDLEFAHDVFGIFENINRQTGDLENGFIPRFAKMHPPGHC